MAVYVDNMRANYGRMVMCHMIADTKEELHAMADAIGISRRWFQHPDDPRWHYDIALSKRAMAIANGAVEITWRQAGFMVMHRRLTGALGEPNTAQAAVQAIMDNHDKLPCLSCEHLEKKLIRAVYPTELGPAFLIPCQFFTRPVYHHPAEHCPGWIQQEEM